MKRIRLNAVPALPGSVEPRLLAAFSRVLASKTLLEGKENQLFAKKLSVFLGGGFVVPVASGHDALVLALKALGVGPGDEVVVPALAYPTAFAVAQSGATIIPVDVNENAQISISSVRSLLTRKTKAVVAVHLFGHMGGMRQLRLLLKKKNIALIEDAAQALGSRYKGKQAGAFADIGCFSFYPTKTLGAPGDGGAVWTKNKKIYEFLRQAKMYGEKTRYDSQFPSFHSRLPELQAAGLNTYFPHIAVWIKKRKALFRLYQRLMPKNVRILTSDDPTEPVPLELAIEADKREALIKYLDKKGIECVIHYPTPFPFVPAFSYLKFEKGAFPQAEALSKKIVSLPLHQFMNASDVRHITSTIKTFYETSRT